MWRAWVCLRPQSAQTKLFLISNTLCPCHSCCDSAVQLGNVACCSFWEVSRVIVHVSSWTIRSRLLVCLTPARPLAVDCELSLCETPLIWPASLHCLTACLSSKWKTWQWWQSALKIRIISIKDLDTFSPTRWKPRLQRNLKNNCFFLVLLVLQYVLILMVRGKNDGNNEN